MKTETGKITIPKKEIDKLMFQWLKYGHEDKGVHFALVEVFNTLSEKHRKILIDDLFDSLADN